MLTLQDLIDMTADRAPVNVEIVFADGNARVPNVVDNYDLPSRDGGAREDCALIILEGGEIIDLEDHLRSFGYNVDGDPIED